MTIEFMSSEESGEDEGQEVLITKPLSWQSERVAHFKQLLDDTSTTKKSPLGRRQMKPRRMGLPSARNKPIGDFPEWAFSS